MFLSTSSLCLRLVDSPLQLSLSSLTQVLIRRRFCLWREMELHAGFCLLFLNVGLPALFMHPQAPMATFL